MAKLKPEVRMGSRCYQPNKAEFEEDVGIDVTPEELARAVLTRVKVVQDTNE